MVSGWDICTPQCPNVDCPMSIMAKVRILTVLSVKVHKDLNRI